MFTSLLVSFLPVWATAAGAEELASFESEVQITNDGALEVKELISWDFGSSIGKHGIFRYVPERSPWNGERQTSWASWQKFERLTPISVQSISSPTNAPARYTRSTARTNIVLKIGDKDRTVSGIQKYAIDYTIKNAVLQDGALEFDVTGDGWTVPVRDVRAIVRGPVLGVPTCKPQPCSVAKVGGNGFEVRGTGTGLHISALVDSSARGKPAFHELQTVRRGFDWTKGQPIGTGVVLLAVGAILRKLSQRGRDLVYASGAVGHDGAPERRRKVTERLASPVEFSPPDNIAPGLISVVRDGEVSNNALSATIIDLARRGHLRIDELELKLRRDDHVLTRLNNPSDQLRQYEEDLLDALFATSSPDAELKKMIAENPKLQQLAAHFGNLVPATVAETAQSSEPQTVRLRSISSSSSLASKFTRIKKTMVDDAVNQGLWQSDPGSQKSKWIMIGVTTMVFGTTAILMLAKASRLALLATPIPLLGLGIIALAPSMGVRTGKGSTMNARLNGFQKLFDAGEGERIALTERAGIFGEYLPYAMAFGNVKQWVKRFEGLGQVPDLGWYGGPVGGFNHGSFSSSMSSFESALNSSMNAASSTPSSSGSGSSGGGGGSTGGGGGGSW